MPAGEEAAGSQPGKPPLQVGEMQFGVAILSVISTQFEGQFSNGMREEGEEPQGAIIFSSTRLVHFAKWVRGGFS